MTTPPVSPTQRPRPDAGGGLGLVDALAQLSFLVHGELADTARTYDLSIAQARLLGVLRDRTPTMGELGRHLGLDKASTSGLIDRAQRRGLVFRTVSERDRRSFEVSTTEEGRAVAAGVAAAFAERIETLVAGLPVRDRELLRHLAGQVVGHAERE